MFNELDLLRLLNFIALGIYFIFGTKFSWNEGIDTCFNVECVLLGLNLHFLGGYFVFTARYLMVVARYLVVAARYRSLLLVPIFSMNAVFYGNNVLSIVVISTKKRYSSFSKEVSFFQKTCFKVKALKIFKICSDYHIKMCRSLRRRVILKIPSTVFLKKPAVFLLTLK